jgi:hypothetical protein
MTGKSSSLSDALEPLLPKLLKAFFPHESLRKPVVRNSRASEVSSGSGLSEHGVPIVASSADRKS